MKTLEHLFLDELARRHDAERRLVLAVPKLARAATSPTLQQFLQSRWKEAQTHVKQVEHVFRLFGRPAAGKECEATTALLADADKIALNFQGLPVFNAALICSFEKIALSGLASYGSLREWAALLGNKAAAVILQSLLDEEAAANRHLVDLAKILGNPAALANMITADFTAPRACLKTRLHPSSSSSSSIFSPGFDDEDDNELPRGSFQTGLREASKPQNNHRIRSVNAPVARPVFITS